MFKRILHSMLRVGDLQASIDFYTQALGMTVLRTHNNTEAQYNLVFLGYQPESAAAVLELTYNQGTHHYQHGNGFGHIAAEVEIARRPATG